MNASARVPVLGSAKPSTLRRTQNAALWIFVASGWFVIVEPAPYEYLLVLAALAFLPSGMSVHRSLAPLVVVLLLYMLGGGASLIPVMDDPRSVRFVAVTAFMGLSALFFAAVVMGDPSRRGAVIKNAYIVAGVIAAMLGLIGYFHPFGLGGDWSQWDRAQGTFKDPNVFATFLVPPFCFLLQGLLLDRMRHRLAAGSALVAIFAAIFFAFSRGAWINAAASAFLIIALTAYLVPSPVFRRRLLVRMVIGAVVASAIVGLALTGDSVRELFDDRAQLLQSYDSGETGRFGNQLNSLPLLLEMPNGMGPHQFRQYFGQDPHNVFVNGFASYGWLGGFSFIILNLLTIWIGWRTIIAKTPWQGDALAVFCPLVVTFVQGIQIDTDHWRHLFLLIGLLWGYHGATVASLERHGLR